VVENVNYLKAEIDLIFREYAYKKQFYREKSSGYFKNVIFDMLRSCMWKGKGSESVNTVLDYVHGHYWEDLCNEKLAEMAGYHPYHLNRLVKSSTGITLRQYIINYRIEVAKKLLRETEMRVSEIAEACGYKNFSNFSEDFKNKAGRSPLKYRSEYRHLM
jgi:AraC-like DNA-binding protein